MTAGAEMRRMRGERGSQAQLSSLSFYVNGKKVVVKRPNPKTALGEFLREEMGLKGLQLTCRQGGCGSCTVVVSPEGGVGGAGVCSCLMPLCSVDGMHVTTIEGLGTLRTGLSYLQKAIVDHNGTQCGYCTPGMIMNMHGLMVSKLQPTPQEIEDHIDGNICRCTGYRPILDAFHSAASADRQFLCLRNRSGHCGNGNIDMEDISWSLPERLIFAGDNVMWMRAFDLQDLYNIMRTNSGKKKVRIVRGNTSTGIYPNVDFDILVDVSRIPSLLVTTVTNEGILIGGAVTIASLMLLLKKHSDLSKSYEPLLRHFKRVASPQVRAVGCVSGNLMITHQYRDFVSDVSTILMGADARLTICSPCLNDLEETMDLERFFEFDMTDKVITKIFLPVVPVNTHFVTRKVALRKVHAHAIVNAAFNVQVDPQTGVVVGQPIIVYGGIKPHPQRAKKTENELVGKSCNDSKAFWTCLSKLQEELVLDPSFGHSEYRFLLVNYYYYYFILCAYPKHAIPNQLLSLVTQVQRPISSGSVRYGQGDPFDYPVSLPLPKKAAAAQATGEIEYLDDLKFSSLHAEYVLSSVANAVIESIDASKALAVTGVLAFLSADTISAYGYCNDINGMETVFASKKVQYHGQAVGLVVAVTKEIAKSAAAMVEIKYQDVKEPIISVEDAIKANSIFDTRGVDFSKGDAKNSFGGDVVIAEGEVYVGHQYQFHMESQRALCVPGEEGCMTVYSSTQNPSLVQQNVSVGLNRPLHKINVNVKRVGGAYGAKLNRTGPVAMACAMAADIVQRPVRLLLDLGTNMKMVGSRSPYLCKYKVAAKKDGRIKAIQMTIYNNQGAHIDFDYPDLASLPIYIDGAYNIENWEIKGRVLKTNLPACTYMRGPVFVETAVMIETILEHVSHEVNVEPSIVRELNMYDKGDVALVGQHLVECNAKHVLRSVQESSDYFMRRAEVKSFNEKNRWLKRGICAVPVKYHARWSGQQMISLVNIHADASISIYQSGCEIGQGLDIKVAQAAAMVLGKLVRDKIFLGDIYVHTTTTIVANNVGETGGSITSEVSVMSVMNACETLVSRLEAISNLISTSGDKPTWHELVAKALDAGVDLQARGRVYPSATPLGPFQYLSFGAAVSEVEVNILSGETTVLRADVLLDCGKSLNPSVDIGQVQGAFIQGLGYHLTEKMTFDENTGELVTDGTWNYKPPSAKDIPIVFNASLLPNSSNSYGVLRSKFSGEPTCAAACSILFAVREALAAARADRGDTKWFGIKSPATVEEVALAANVSANMLAIP